MGDFLTGVSKTFDFLTSPIAALGGLIEAKMPGSKYAGQDNLDYWDYVNIHRGNYGDVSSAAGQAGEFNGVPSNSSSGESSLDTSGYDQAQWEYEKQLELLADQRAFNSAEAQKNRDWQERMSNTAYQRAVQDLEAAGLNKWLAVTGGNGASASTPAGSSATSSAGDASAPNPKLAQALLQFSQSVLSTLIKVVSD